MPSLDTNFFSILGSPIENPPSAKLRRKSCGNVEIWSPDSTRLAVNGLEKLTAAVGGFARRFRNVGKLLKGKA